MTWAHATRDIVVTAITKGQLLPLILGCIILLIVWKMPPDGIRELAISIIQKLENFYILGWFLWIVTAAGLLFVSKWRRLSYRNEIRRIGLEKSELQTKLLGNGAPSSEQNHNP